jgi:hypothetical protein
MARCSAGFPRRRAREPALEDSELGIAPFALEGFVDEGEFGLGGLPMTTYGKRPVG